MQQITWRHQWDYNALAEVREVTNIDCSDDPGMTLQAPAEESDINVIIKRFGISDGSVLPYWPAPNGIYGDLSTFPDDPTEIANIMAEAKQRFMTLPGEVRQRFPDPESLFAWLNDDANITEARRLGLLKPEEVPATPVVTQPTTAP